MSRATDFVSKTPYLTAEIELPSGRSVLLRRPPIQAWAIAGVLPPFFAIEVKEAWKRARGSGVFDPANASGQQLLDMLEVIRGLARWAFVEPRLEDGGDGTDGAVDPTYLTAEDWQFLMQWFLKGSPEIPVPTTDGEVQVSDLSRFHQVG